jgi:hypothetical protein
MPPNVGDLPCEGKPAAFQNTSRGSVYSTIVSVRRISVPEQPPHNHRIQW